MRDLSVFIVLIVLVGSSCKRLRGEFEVRMISNGKVEWVLLESDIESMDLEHFSIEVKQKKVEEIEKRWATLGGVPQGYLSLTVEGTEMARVYLKINGHSNYLGPQTGPVIYCQEKFLGQIFKDNWLVPEPYPLNIRFCESLGIKSLYSSFSKEYFEERGFKFVKDWGSREIIDYSPNYMPDCNMEEKVNDRFSAQPTKLR